MEQYPEVCSAHHLPALFEDRWRDGSPPCLVARSEPVPTLRGVGRDGLLRIEQYDIRLSLPAALKMRATMTFEYAN